MIWYALQRLGLALLICVLALTILFCAVYVIPGDPASIALGPRASDAMKAALRARMGLDQPLVLQVLYFFGNTLRGDLGVDVMSNRSVATIVMEALPHTLALALAGLGWAVVLGIPLGCLSAVRRGTLVDRLVGVVSVATISMPSFVVAIYGLLIFAVALQWLPAIGAGNAGDPGDQLLHLILPAFAVGLGWVGYLARLVRASMLEVMGENHIRTARAFGLRERTIVYRYALRIAILPTVTLIGIGIGSLLSSAVFAEVVFNRPGIGSLVFGAAQTRNYPVVMGAVLVTVFLFALFNLLADLLVALLDARVRAGL
ncbi:ABC transporter permease [Mycobacterium sp. KBS0706]|uniref:ABC transporter permease n=1 Tax=Mycobacterium sp. KBS0706 TaxID=2578109 RepID=UPI00110F857C|nr:ABC transporter permease [Mycobacterium sp. KBS0706]TSD84769.1 ABC transporter permease [Mycobacterium sp. KBS0706]